MYETEVFMHEPVSMHVVKNDFTHRTLLLYKSALMLLPKTAYTILSPH